MVAGVRTLIWCGAVVASLVLLARPAGAGGVAAADDPDAVTVSYNVMVPMRDGIRLSTDIYRPRTDGRFPVILVRSPYSNGSEPRAVDEGRFWASQGYVYLRQDVRGRYDSDGQYYPYIFEINDGYDAQQWAGTQPWSNGKVGMLGGSYLAAVQWLPAALGSPYLKAITPVVSPFNYYRDVVYVGGALALASRIGWASGMAGRTGQRLQVDWHQVYWHLPLISLDEALGIRLTHWRDWIHHPSYDPYWQVLDSERRFDDLDLPALSVGGWYGVFQRGTTTSYIGMVRHARTPAARRAQRLIIGPWPHGANRSTRTGDLDFGPDSLIDLKALQLRWMDQWLKGRDTGLLDEPPVRIFVMGENRWRSEQEWPLARTRYTNYYFHGGGSANGVHGDGRLDTTAPGADPAETFVYDPADPVPTHGGNLLGRVPAGPFDQREVEARPDVLVFTGDRLDIDLEVTGPVHVTLYAASSARDTDFTAKLVDVHPDGAAYNLADGIIRARYRESFATPVLLEPNTVYRYVIDLWSTSNVFKQGHRLRVEISSSNFPHFDRNPNTGHPFGLDAELLTATQTIYNDAEHPSHIVLPVIPR